MEVDAEGVASAVARVFGEQSRAVEVSRAVVGGAGDWKWSGGGSVQELDWQAIEADMGGVGGEKSQSNGNY